jgi:exopolyphosphatase / guanosine-5'-triphosphate,3'-diphosphate pyrophosphatase
VDDARKHFPEVIRIIGTSAARDAVNREDFARLVLDRTGVPLEILSGEREAELIGAAVQLDPSVSAEDYYVFDLGGGSLECLRFRHQRLEQVVSLQLGAVRLAEKLLENPAAPFTARDEARVREEVVRGFRESGFGFSLPPGGIGIGTGGTLTASLDIVASEQGLKLRDVRPFLSREHLRRLLDRIGPLSLAERLEIPKLSAGRADVFPTALATFLALLEVTGLDGLHHSLLNLRYGMAAELLQAQVLRSKGASTGSADSG